MSAEINLVIVLTVISTVVSLIRFIMGSYYEHKRLQYEREKMKWRRKHPYPGKQTTLERKRK